MTSKNNLLLCGILTGACDTGPPCKDGSISKPSNYAFSQENWACSNNAIASTLELDAVSFHTQSAAINTDMSGNSINLTDATSFIVATMIEPVEAAWEYAADIQITHAEFVETSSTTGIIPSSSDLTYHGVSVITLLSGDVTTYSYPGVSKLKPDTIATTTTSTSTDSADNPNQIVECDISFFTQYTPSGGSLQDIYYSQNTVSTSASSKPYLFDMVLMHEVGHCLGLDHVPPTSLHKNSVMWPTIYKNTVGYIDSIDETAAEYLYGL
jgi:hypothetical protein